MDWTVPGDQYINALYTVHSAFYTLETNLWTNIKTLSVKVSSVVVMHDKVKACKHSISSVSIVECDYTFILL